MSSRALRSPLHTAALAAVIFLMGPSGHAQESARGKTQAPYALIFGTVYDPTGRPVYGIKIVLRRADAKKPRWELISNHQGEFAQRIPAGKAEYVLTTEVKKTKDFPFGPAQQKTVQVENEERQDVSLHLTE